MNIPSIYELHACGFERCERRPDGSVWALGPLGAIAEQEIYVRPDDPYVSPLCGHWTGQRFLREWLGQWHRSHSHLAGLIRIATPEESAIFMAHILSR